jgi:hypothetical protein
VKCLNNGLGNNLSHRLWHKVQFNIPPQHSNYIKQTKWYSELRYHMAFAIDDTSSCHLQIRLQGSFYHALTRAMEKHQNKSYFYRTYLLIRRLIVKGLEN